MRSDNHLPKCSNCGKTCACGAVHCSNQSGLFLCFDCLDSKTKDSYPLFRAEHDQAVKRRERVIINSGLIQQEAL